MGEWQVVRALDCSAKHRWFEPNPRIIVGMFAHCPPSSNWVPGGNTGEVKGDEERNWPPYLTMPALRISVPLTGTPPTYGIVHGTHLEYYKATIFLRKMCSRFSLDISQSPRSAYTDDDPSMIMFCPMI